jgi:UDP-N-acetylmuramate--alanine ligase
MTHVAERTIPQRVHLVGIGGIHMSGIARILRERGHTVSGSDLHRSPLTHQLEDIDVTVHEGHAAGNIDDAQLVVYTSAAHGDNPELLEARRRGIEAIKRAEMVAVLAQGRQVIAVAGAHGKTTTSSAIAYVLHKGGFSPTVLLGGEARNFGTNAIPGDGPPFVVEADEYDRAFLNYHPYIAVVTNVEPDHLDIYGSFEELQRAYAQFLAQVENSGYIVACLDSPPLQACLSQRQALLPRTVGGDVTYPVHVVSYSHLSPEADWYAEIVDKASKGVDGSTFMVRYQNKLWGEFVTRLPGVHNVSNSLAAIAVGEIAGVPKDTVREAIAEFQGAARRFEFVGEAAAVVVMDDYAHHPTEIRASLAAARTRFPDKRIVVLFQPHTYTRTAYLLDDFRGCFTDCDVLYMADTYAAREDPAAGMDAKALADEITSPKAVYAGAVAEAAQIVARELLEGDVFFTLGAGDVDKAGPLVLEALESR